MRKLFKYWWIGVCTVFLILSAFTPQIINWVYPNEGFWFTKTTFKETDLLSFYGLYLSFLGTVSLGALALWQNHKFKKSNEKKERLAIRPYLFTSCEDLNMEFLLADNVEFFEIKCKSDKDINVICLQRNKPQFVIEYERAQNIIDSYTKGSTIIKDTAYISAINKQITLLSDFKYKYQLFSYAVSNFGVGSAVNIDISLNKNKLCPLFCLGLNQTIVLNLLCNLEDTPLQSKVSFEFEISYFDMEDFGPYSQNEIIYIDKINYGIHSLNFKEQISQPVVT